MKSTIYQFNKTNPNEVYLVVRSVYVSEVMAEVTISGVYDLPTQ